MNHRYSLCHIVRAGEAWSGDGTLAVALAGRAAPGCIVRVGEAWSGVGTLVVALRGDKKRAYITTGSP